MVLTVHAAPGQLGPLGAAQKDLEANSDSNHGVRCRHGSAILGEMALKPTAKASQPAADYGPIQL
jgi:hypothetical protein